MATLREVRASKIIDDKRHIHDVSDAGADLALSAGVEIGFPVSNTGYEYTSDGDLWVSASSLFTGGILDQAWFIKWAFTIRSASNNASLLLRLVIPDPAGDIEVFSNTYSLPTLNTDYPFSNTTLAYNGPEALEHGLKIMITPSNNSTLKARSVLGVLV